MATKNDGGGSHHGPHVFYGGPIHNCIKRGNKDEMEEMLAQAKAHYAEEGDLGNAIKELEAALKKKY